MPEETPLHTDPSSTEAPPPSPLPAREGEGPHPLVSLTADVPPLPEGEGESAWDDDHDDWDDDYPEDLQGDADAAPDDRDPVTTRESEKTNIFGGAAIPPREKAVQTDEDKKVRAESMKILTNVGNFGLFLLITLVFGYYIGKWCDKMFGTKPVFTVIWIGFAVAASIRELYRNIKAAQKLGEDAPPPSPLPGGEGEQAPASHEETAKEDAP